MPVSDKRGVLTPGTLIPIWAAILVFGVVYGAAAQPLFGTPLTLLSSLVVFSGTVQFTMVGLLAAAAAPIAILWAVFVVNIRNVALGGAVRPHLRSGVAARFGLSWFLIDETVGLALVDPKEADRVLLLSGFGAYLSWNVGTVLGALGGATFGLESLAASVFPVLFIGLASLMIRDNDGVVRSVAGGLVTLVLVLVWPVLAGLAPVVGGLLVALPRRRR